MSAWIALSLLVVAGLALLLRGDTGTIAGYDPADFAIAVAGVALIIFIGSSLSGSYRGRATQAVRDFLTWVIVAVALIGGYSYRQELLYFGHRITGELLPPGSALRPDAQVDGERSVRIRKRPDGHFLAKTTVNGVVVDMLVDTGATTVVLKSTDAKKLGIDLGRLRYTVPVQTANGTALAAHVQIRTLAVGTISVTGVDALVAQPGVLRENLLGMSFLSRLRSYEFMGEYLTLRS